MRNHSLLFCSLLFLILFFSCVQSQTIDGYFYKGLSDSENASAYFEKALESKNIYIRGAAANELASLIKDGAVSSNLQNKIRKENYLHQIWKDAFEAVSFKNQPADKEKVLTFLLTNNFNPNLSILTEARIYVLYECKKNNVFKFTEQEWACIEGHYYSSGWRYNESLSAFRSFQAGDEWPLLLPEIFITYPDLINDLGRTFQYTNSGTEGMELFLQWADTILNTEYFSLVTDNSVKNAEITAALMDMRYRLIFFAARIARRAGLAETAISLFEQSLLLTPNSDQTDACIWYILDLCLLPQNLQDAKSHDVFLQHVKRFLLVISDINYFNDVYEKFLHILAVNSDWNRIIQTYNFIKNTDASIRSAYAYIIYRVLEEGYEITEQTEEKYEYINTAYNASLDYTPSVLYYRALSASILEQTFLPENIQVDNNLSKFQNPAQLRKNYPALYFINGFFSKPQDNIQDKAITYLLQIEKELSIEELRLIAETLGKTQLYTQTMRFVSRYTDREDYTGLNLSDFKFLYPCPYRDIAEKYCSEYNFPNELIYGLIRTESAFQSAVVSHAGAVGLMQLMPDTANEMAGRLKRAGGPDYTENNFNLTEPEQNIHLGVYYLDYLKDRFDNELLLLMAYNGGMNRIRRLRDISALPDDIFLEAFSVRETRDYAKKVIGAREVYRSLYFNE